MITPIANAGVLISYKHRKILIDGIHREPTPPFESVQSDLLERVIEGQDPFAVVDIALFTHDHKDHFDLSSTIRFIEKNEKVLVYGPEKLCIKLRNRLQNDFDRRRVIHADISGTSREFGEGIRIRSLSIPHEGKQYSDVVNIAYKVELFGIKILHLGDAALNAMASTNYKVLTDDVDLALLNFPFLTLERGRQIISEVIQPQKVYVLHLPNKTEDRFDWIGKTIQVVETYGDVLPEVEIFGHVG